MGLFTNTSVTRITFAPNVTTTGSAFNWFYVCTNLKSVSNLPRDITNMASCFGGCRNFNSAITIPPNVKDMAHAFSNCIKFNQPITIPEGVTTIAGCFNACYNLNQNFVLPQSLINMRNAFAMTKNIRYLPVIPNNVTDMGSSFRGMSNIKPQNITIPDSVLNLKSCFVSTNNIDTINIGRGATDIAEAFMYCNVKNVYIFSENITAINNAFGWRSSYYERVNVFIKGNTTTNNTFYNGGNVNLVGTIKWTTITNGYWNGLYNIYVYYNLTDE